MAGALRLAHRHEQQAVTVPEFMGLFDVRHYDRVAANVLSVLSDLADGTTRASPDIPGVSAKSWGNNRLDGLKIPEPASPVSFPVTRTPSQQTVHKGFWPPRLLASHTHQTTSPHHPPDEAHQPGIAVSSSNYALPRRASRPSQQNA